ncbi:MAG: AI-2E family transporter [Bacteroidales bacterium]|jgi:predicted PurR-regulated permease PerM|nr:AI-2E family transporter [Bacteroidales bacterium]
MKNAAYFFITAAAIILILIYGKGILMPVIVAFLLWILMRGIRFSLDRVGVIKRFIPGWIKNIMVLCIILFGFEILYTILSSGVKEISGSYMNYQPNIQHLSDKIGNLFNVNLVDTVKSSMDNFDFANILNQILNAFSGILSNAFMIIIYLIFIFTEVGSFKTKLHKIFDGKGKYDKVKSILNKIESSITNYLGLKTIVSLVTGVLSYIVLLIVGVDSAVVWAFLIFLLNYIPTIGSLIATAFPALFSLIQFGQFTPFIIVLVTIGGVQVLVGNFLEPRIMGKSLNLSPLVTLIALALWGQIWGITGMVLSVPITVIMLLVFSQFEKTRAVAILLSQNGKID